MTVRRIPWLACLLLLALAGGGIVGKETGKPGRPVKELIAVVASPNATHAQKWEAVIELKGYGDKAVPGLLQVLSQPDVNDSRYYAIRALGYLKSRTATKALSRILLDRGYGPRRYAAIALGQIGDPKAVPVLAKALADRSYVRDDALDALVKIDSRESRKTLERYHFADSDPCLKLEISCKPASCTVGDRITVEAKLTNVNAKNVRIIVTDGEPMAYLVFQRADGGFVESVDTGLREDRTAGSLVLHKLKQGAPLEWRHAGTVKEWTRGEKDDHAFVPSGKPFLTLDFRQLAHHIRRPGEFRVRVVLRQDKDALAFLRSVPGLEAGSADVGLEKAVSNAAAFSVVSSSSRGRGDRP